MLDAEQSSVIKLRWLTKIFVAGDVLSFLMQASGKIITHTSIPAHQQVGVPTNFVSILGAGIMVKDMTNPSTGENIIIGGLFVQIIFFGFFAISAVIFQVRLSKRPTARSIELSSLWHKHMIALYVASVLILVRSVIRVVEYLQGYDGYLMRTEAFIYVFDALLMFVTMLVLQYAHPSEVNCLLGRGECYSEKIYKTRKFVAGSALETSGVAEP